MTLSIAGRCLALLALAALPGIAASYPAASGDAVQGATGFELVGQQTQGGWLRGTAPAGAGEVRLGGVSVPLDAERRFFIAFDRDAGPDGLLEATLTDGRTVTTKLAIAPRAWQIERIAVPLRPSATPPAEFLRRRSAEVARIAAARAIDSHSEGWRQRLVWPVRGRISGRFGSQRIYQGVPGSYHSGIDISTGQSGTPFVAPADGVVILAAESPFTLEGNLLMIDHGMGLNSAFLHCSQLLVKAGDVVRQGQVIGRIGMTGRASGPHLHWSIKWRDARLDPPLLAGAMP